MLKSVFFLIFIFLALMAYSLTPPTSTDVSQPQVVAQDIYTSPGIATLQGGQWVGSEHLFNLSSNIGIVVEVIKPASVSMPITEASIKDKISAIFKASGLAPRATAIERSSPLPFFHFFVMLNPIEKGFVAYCAGRLFEQVNTSRVYLKTNYIWQAITWEKQELLVFPAEQLQEQIEAVAQRISTAFGDKYRTQTKH